MALTKIDDRGLKTPIDLIDNEKIRLGTGNDLEIYHDGSNSYIKDTGTGGLAVNSNHFWVADAANSDYLINAVDTGTVELYYDGSKKFYTGNSGVAFIGNLYGNDNEKVLLGSSSDLQIYHDGSHSYILDTGTGDLNIGGSVVGFTKSDASEWCLRCIEDAQVELYHNNVKKLETTSSGAKITGGLDMGGHVWPYPSNTYDLGTSDYKWRNIWMTNDLYIDDNGMAVFGTGEDLQIYHDASHSWMKNTTGNIVIHTGTGRFKVWSDGNEEMIDAAPGGGVKLCYNDSSKLETISTGVNITGGIRLGGDNAVNEMDDYEEGVHNPSITSNGGGSITLKSAQDTLAYTKVGRMVHVQGRLDVDSVSSPSGDIYITLPFTPNSQSDLSGHGAAAIFCWAPNGDGYPWVAWHDDSQARLYMREGKGDNPAPSASKAQANTEWRINVTYSV